MPDLAKIAYEAYCVSREWKSFDGKPLPQWHDVNTDIRSAWDAATQAVLRAINPE